MSQGAAAGMKQTTGSRAKGKKRKAPPAEQPLEPTAAGEHEVSHPSGQGRRCTVKPAQALRWPRHTRFRWQCERLCYLYQVQAASLREGDRNSRGMGTVGHSGQPGTCKLA
jgi:hypothetical protein